MDNYNEVINPLKDKTEYSWQFEQNVYDENGLTRALKAGGGSGNIPKIIEFKFPSKQELKLKLKDLLENEVEEKYYLSKKMQDFVIDGYDEEIKVKDFKLKIKNATKKGYKEAIDGDSVNLQYPNSTTRRGRVGHQVSQTLMANDNMGVIENLKIRKLTPKECWRLMGFSDEDFEKAKNIPTSNTQLYKQAGNSIVVNVLEKIFRNLLMR